MFSFITCLHVSEKAKLLSCIVHSRNGDGEIRTHDPLLARQVLSQLSYTPTVLYALVKAFRLNGLKWTRTTDLTLIRRAL